MQKTLKKGTWCWPCLDEHDLRVQAVEEIDNDPYCEICANKLKARRTASASTALAEVLPEPALVVLEMDAAPLAALSPRNEAFVFVPNEHPEPTPKKSMATILRDSPVRFMTTLHAKSEEEHAANEVWQALSCSDKWALLGEVK